MSDLSAIVAASVASARESGSLESAESSESTPDTGDTHEDTPSSDTGDSGESTPPAADATGTDGEGVPSEGEGTGGGETETVQLPAGSKPPELDDTDRELEALGIKAPKLGERENRLPHSRIKKIFTNAQKKWVSEHAVQLKERDDKLAANTSELENYRRADQLSATDPDRYIGMLAAIHPDKYKKYVSGGGSTQSGEAKPAVAPSIAALGPRPAPDTKFDDGSLGYSPEQHEKLLDWVSATAEAKAYTRSEEAFSKRFGPIEKEWLSNRARQEKLPQVQAQTAAAKKRWGALYEAEEKLGTESGLFKHLVANPQVPFDAAVADYLLPKLHADRDKMRAELTTEMNARPAAAAKAVPGATSGAKEEESSGPKTTAQIVRESIQRMRR